MSTGLLAEYEGFRVTFPTYDSGTGFAGAWIQGGFGVGASDYIASGNSLIYLGLATSGGSIGGVASPVINGAVRGLAVPLGEDGTTAYISFLVEPRGSLNEGVFNGFFGLTLLGDAGELFTGKPGGGALADYILETRGGGGQVSSGAPLGIGETRLLIVKAEFAARNDIFTLYTDAVPGEPEPPGTAIKTDLDLGLVSAIGIYSTGAFAIDEIRIGSAFDEVTPVGVSNPWRRGLPTANRAGVSATCAPEMASRGFNVKRTRDNWEAELKTEGMLTNITYQSSTAVPGATTGWHSHPGPLADLSAARV